MIRTTLALLAALAVPAVPPAAEHVTPHTSAGAAAPRYAGRALESVLAELRDGGLKIVSSSRLVRAEMHVASEPRARTPRAVLDEVLKPHGLAVRPGPADTLVVVEAEGPTPRSGSGDGREGDGMRLGFAERVDVRGHDPAPAAAPAQLRLRGVDVTRVAGAVDNVFRAVQLLPGVDGAGVSGTRLAVRGGGPDQNLTVMDGVEVHNPFRLFGLVTNINPETVERFDLTSGAFPARYGDRLSSLLVVETRDGRRDTRLAGSTGLSLSDASAVFEGRLPGTENASWLLAGRRTYYDLVAERVVDDELPKFHDLQAKLTWSGAAGRRVTVTALAGGEGTDAGFSEARDELDVFTDGGSGLFAANFETPLGRRAVLRSVASLYSFDETLDFDGHAFTDTRVSFDRASPLERGSSIDQQVTFDLGRRVSVRDLATRHEVVFDLGPRQRLEAGLELHHLSTRWRLALAGGRNDEAANGSSMLFGSGLPDFLDSRADTARAAAFVQHRWQAGAGVVVEPGLRVERASGLGGAAVSPRLHARVDLGRIGELRAGAGLHQQAPGYEKLFHSDYFVDLSPPARRGLRTERALHLVLGLDRRLARDVSVSVEGYYRSFGRLVVGRLETDVERLARLARFDFPPELLWSLPVEPGITSVAVNGARGRAYGLLAFVQKLDSPESRVAGWISYAWGVADRTAYGRKYPFDYDRRHVLTAAGNWRAGSRWELSATARAASGRPVTPPRGVRVLGAPDENDHDGDGDRGELVPARDAAGRLVYEADPGGAATLNSGRLPFYARVDARLTFRPKGPSGRWQFYLEALNVLDRRNAAGYDWDIRLDPGAERPRIEVGEGENGLPLLPTFGVRFHF